MYYKFVITKTGSMTADIAVYTEFKENWQYFFDEPTMTPDAPGSVDKTVQVREHTRRSGPGDSGKKVSAHPRKYARTAKNKGSARPGRPYVMVETDPISNGVIEKRQFAIQGLDMDVIAYAKAKAKKNMQVRNERGWTSVIPKAVTSAVVPTLVVP